MAQTYPVRDARMVGIKQPLEYLVIGPSFDKGFLSKFAVADAVADNIICHLSKPDDPKLSLCFVHQALVTTMSLLLVEVAQEEDYELIVFWQNDGVSHVLR